MEYTLWVIAGLLVMTASLVLTPLGLPGNWIMLIVPLVAMFYGHVSWWAVLIMVGLVGLAELAEFLLVKIMSERYGASTRAFWGAIGGGIVGVIVGAPVPVVGSLLAGVAGTFLGAAVVSYWETMHLDKSVKRGWGAVLGRAAAAAIKTAAGIVVIVITAGGLAFF